MVIAGIGIAAGVGQSVVGYQAQKSQAEALARFQNEQYAATAKASRQALIQNYADLRARQAQESYKASQEIQAVALESMRAQSTARASALGAGVTGLSLQGLTDEYVRQQSLFVTATQYQQRAVQQQLYRQGLGARAQAESRTLAATPQPVATPSLAAAGIGAAASAASWLSLGATREAFGLGRSPSAQIVTTPTGGA
jgi:hypothetical protein